MGCKSYEQNGTWIHFSENDDDIACLCTFPHNYTDKRLDAPTMRSLAMLGAATVLARQGLLEHGTLPSALPAWIVAEINRLSPDDDSSAASDDWIPVEWQRRSERKEFNSSGVSIVEMVSPFYAGNKYAVRRNGRVLNKSSDWEFEPMPSSRNDAFYARCRFDHFVEAHRALTIAEGATNWKHE